MQTHSGLNYSKSNRIVTENTVNIMLSWIQCTDEYNPLTHTHNLFNGPLSGTTRVSRYQKGKTNVDFNEARDSEWQWHQLGHM